MANMADTKAEKGDGFEGGPTSWAIPDWDLGVLNTSEEDWIRGDIHNSKKKLKVIRTDHDSTVVPKRPHGIFGEEICQLELGIWRSGNFVRRNWPPSGMKTKTSSPAWFQNLSSSSRVATPPLPNLISSTSRGYSLCVEVLIVQIHSVVENILHFCDQIDSTGCKVMV